MSYQKEPTANILLESQRLTLRLISQDDAAFMLKLVNTAGWLQFVGDRNVHNELAAKSFIQTWALDRYKTFGYGPYMIQLKPTNELIGICGLFKRDYLEYPDLGFAVLPEFNGQGMAQEASKAVIKYAFEGLNIPKLYAITAQHNINSSKLLIRLGFKEIPPFNNSTDKTFELNH